MIDAIVVDTNVLVVANRKAEHASAECVLVCIGQLTAIQKREKMIAIDNMFHILNEYRRNCNSSGQPGVGDAFLKWLFRNMANPACCEQVPITQNGRKAPRFSAGDISPASR